MADPTPSSSFTKPPGPPLIGALLRIPWEAVREQMLARLHSEGFDDFDGSYLGVFQYPGPNGQRPADLAASLRVSKQALNHLLGQLERRGYLTREADPSDGRSKRIQVTDRGQRAGLVMREAVAEMEEAWTQQLGAERFAQLRALLEELDSSERH